MGNTVRPIASQAGRSLSPPSPIRPFHRADDFFCTHQCLDDWLKQKALKAQTRSTARTYVVVEGDDHIVGYYCLVMGSVRRIDAPKKLGRNAPEQIPVAIIGRLAVTKQREGYGIGSGMLQDAFKRVMTISEFVGCAAVIVHAIDREACEFYTKYGFIEFPIGTKTLFMPVGTLRASL